MILLLFYTFYAIVRQFSPHYVEVKVPMIRIFASLCVITWLFASSTACGSKRDTVPPPPEKALATKLCQAEYQLQDKLRTFRKNSSGRNLVAVGQARGTVFVTRRELGTLVGAQHIAGEKLEWCGKISLNYLAISNQRVTRAAKSLCREVRTQRFVKRNNLVVTDSLVEPLKLEYSWHAEWYNEDSLRASSRKDLPKEAKSLKQVLRSC